MIPMEYADIMRAITLDRIAHKIDSSNQKLMEAIDQYQANIKDKPGVKNIKLHNYKELNARKVINGVTLSLKPSSVFTTLAAEEEYYPYTITEQSNLLPSFSNPKPQGGGIVKIYKPIEEDDDSSLDENIGKYVRMVVRYEDVKPVYKKQQPVGYSWSKVPLKVLKSKEFFVEHIFSQYEKAMIQATKHKPSYNPF
jgi:hypothetical protein